MPSVVQKAGNVAENVALQVKHAAKSIEDQLETATNRLLPRTRREHMVEQARDYANRNPKAAAFLATQAALTGLPLVLFLAFAAATLLVSLTTCLFLGLITSLALTFFVVSFALLFVIPTVFIASCSATFVFTWGFVGYVILRKFNERGASNSPNTQIARQRQSNGAVINGQAADAEQRRYSHTTDSGDNAPVNGAHATIEWEMKSAEGVKPDQLVLETDNAYEVLKAETQAPSVSSPR